MERLAEECNVLRGDLQRREAMVNHRDGVIAGLRDEPYTFWASGCLVFRRKVAKAFPGLDFNFSVPDLDDEEVEESIFEDEADPGVFSNTLSSTPPPGEAKVSVEAGSFLSPARASPSDLHGLEARTAEAARNPTSNIYAPLYNLCSFWLISSFKPRTFVTLALVLLFYRCSSFYLLGFPVFFYDLC